MSEVDELKPKPLQLQKKPRGVRIEDLETAAVQCFAPTDLETSKCSGAVYGQGVLVTQLQHIWALVKLGSYGKGMFSRSIPCHQRIPLRDEMKQVSRKRGATVGDSEAIEVSWVKRMRLHSQWKKEGESMAQEGEYTAQWKEEEGMVREEGTEQEGTALWKVGECTEEGTAEGKDTAQWKKEEGMTREEGTALWKEEGEGTAQWKKKEGMAREEDTALWKEGESMAQDEEGTAQWTEEEEGTPSMVETGPTLGSTSVDEKSSLDDDYQKFILRLNAVKKNDPYFIEEYLQLGAEEAFYLAAEVGLLTVNTDEARILTNNDLWLHFNSLNTSFCSRYAAYSHYRAGNWVPKSGLKFGVDFLLYKESPLSYHSSFAVVVKADGEAREGTKYRNSLTWREVVALGRVSESARKDLLVCHVTWPRGATKEKPCCIDTATVTDILVKRWIPERDR